MRGLDLFSGIGGLSLALRPYVQTVAYCEIQPYCQAVLLERMHSGDLDIAPIWDDVRTLNSEILDTEIDIIFGGFPCQDVSVAGRQAGIAEGTRSGLFFQVMRLVDEFRPKFIFLENVAAICSNGLDVVLQEIAKAGYDAQWCCVSAAEVGAPHKRNRWWLLAYANGTRLQKTRAKQQTTRFAGNGFENSAAIDSISNHRFPAGRGTFQYEWEPTRCIESRMGRNVDGLSFRTHRLKALGNAVVPQAARKAFETLMFVQDNA